MPSWWETYPEALQAELRSLQDRGLPYEEDIEARQAGRLVLRVKVNVEGAERELRAYYPDSFPYFAPQVQLLGQRFQRHHNFRGFLCLLGNDGDAWEPGVHTLGWLLTEQLSQIVLANAQATAQERADIEEHAGEPVSNFLKYFVPEVILVPDQAPAGASGTMTLAAVPNQAVVAAVQATRDQGGRAAVTGLSASTNMTATLPGYWCRLPERPVIANTVAQDGLEQMFHNVLMQHCSELRQALVRSKRGTTLIGACVVPDEVSWNETKDDWIFLRYQVTQEGRKGREAQFNFRFVRADRAGPQAFLQRAPFLSPLREKRVLLVGAGNVGSPVAMQLARAGLSHLDVIEPDVLQVGNTLRWALGRRYAGWHKATAIADAIKHDFPLTKVEAYLMRVGDVAFGADSINYDQKLRELVRQADLVIDGTASYRASHFLADLCRHQNKPYLWITTTPGGAGGVVGRVLPDNNQGCWHCFQRRLADGTIRLPADTGAEGIQPGGCAHPTFIAAGLDTDEVCVLASRLTVATLCRGTGGDGYKDFAWNVAIGDFQRGCNSIAAQWDTYPLEVHQECQDCARRQASASG